MGETVSRSIRPQPSGGATQHIVAEPPAERTDGKQTRADREKRTSESPPKERRKPNLVQTTTVLVIVLIAAGLAFLAIKKQEFLPYAALVLLLCAPALVARIKRLSGKAIPVEGLVPERGGRGIFWKLFGADLYAIFGWSWLKAPSLRDRENQLLNTLWGLRHVQKILAFANSKGSSGKTPVCTWLGCLLAYAIKQPPLALDINENPNHTATWLGIDPSSTLQLRAFLRACLTGTMETAAKLLSQCQWHRQTGTKVISAEATSLEAFTPEQVIVGIKVAKMHNHSVFCDLGNGIIASGNWGAVAMADTLVICGNVTTANSEQDVASTMQRYTELGHGRQVEHSIIVILGAKLEQRSDYAARYSHPLEQVYVIPQNEYMAKGNPVDLFKIPRSLRVIMLEILVAIVKAEAVAKGSIDRSKTQELTIEEGVASTDADSPVPPAPSGATVTIASVQ